MFLDDIEKELKEECEKCLPQLKVIDKKSDVYYKEMSLIEKPVLILLLDKAIDKIDELQNGGEYDERDAMDMLCDKEFIFKDLIKECIECCELFVEKVD